MYVNEFAVFQAGFFRADPHQVAFYRRFQRGRRFLLARQHLVQLSNQENIPTAVAVAAFFQSLYAKGFRFTIKAVQDHAVRLFFQHNFPKRAVEGDSSAASVCKRRHQ